MVGYMRGKMEGCLATEPQAIMEPCIVRGGPHNEKQPVTLDFVNIIYCIL